MEKVAIIGPIDNKGRAALKKGLSDKFEIIEIDDETQYGKLLDVEYAILRTFKISRDVISKTRNLKLIQRWGVGYDSVDIEAAGEKDIKVAVTAGINSIPVAEYAVMLMLAVYRNILKIHSNVVDGTWRDNTLIDKSYIISGKKVGLVGLGAIGKEVAKRVQAFEAEVYYYDMFRLSQEDERKLDIEYMELDNLLRECDIISLHLPLTDSTKYLIDKKALNSMKDTTLIINTSRGGIINEDDLYEALANNKILGAGMDVFENEPVPQDNKLLKLKNIILSSHNAGNTTDNSINMAKRCVDNILKVSRNEDLTKGDLVNEKYLKK
jgi:lactate dehydrogenase-like 2-hydroxyacid dehydrogenase